jgi:hypothetical protein
MEIQLVIFLAFTSVTLSANTVVVWLAYRAFANMTSRVTEGLHEVCSTSEARSFLESLEIASSQAAAMTGVAKRQIEELDPILARAQDVYTDGLARIDTKLGAACTTIAKNVESAQDSILRPATRVGMFAAGIQSVVKMANDANRGK